MKVDVLKPHGRRFSGEGFPDRGVHSKIECLKKNPRLVNAGEAISFAQLPAYYCRIC